jgi:hypothetical protein
MPETKQEKGPYERKSLFVEIQSPKLELSHLYSYLWERLNPLVHAVSI